MANLNFIQRFLVWLGNVPLEREIVYPVEKKLIDEYLNFNEYLNFRR